jgi:uncharacterized membrane protein YgdD (TMEM256/DUF423 family)
MHKIFLLAGTISGALAVMIGAFGAHAMKATLEANQRLDTFETAVKYQFYHSLALMALGIIMMKASHRLFPVAGYSYIIGILIFSGSLYTLSLTGVTKWGAVTPIGGLALIIGWISMLIGIARAID